MKKIFTFILLFVAVMMSAQEVPTSFPRKSVIEHFTGDGCGYCPGGMYAIVDYIDNQNPSAIWISHHYGYNTDEYTISESSRIGKMLGVQGAPNMALNRTKQMGTTIGFHPGYLPEITINEDTVAEASVLINHTFNAETRQLDITVSGQVANTEVESYLLTVLIKENRLVGKQADYTYSWKTSPWKEYMHARVIRDVLSADAFGDTVYVENQAYSKTLTYTVSEDWVAENCCVVAYLTPTNKKPIINAEQAPLIAGTTGGEQYYPYGITESQAPNTPDKITFDSVAISKPADDKLELVFYSNKSIRSSLYGALKSILVVEFNTTADTLPVDTFDIQSNNAENTLTAGYHIDETRSFGGSRFQYVDSKELAQGNIVPYHTWKLNTGKLAYSEDGNLLLAGNFANSKHFTMTAFIPRPIYTSFADTLCFGESYVWNEQTYTTTGVYEQKLKAVNGADSIVTLTLTILPEVPATTQDVTIEFNDTYLWNGQKYKKTGVYTTTLQDENGCPYQATLNLTVLPNPCLETTALLEPTSNLVVSLNTAFDVYRIDYQSWLESGVNLIWTGKGALHTFVAKDCGFAVSIHHRDVVNYTEVPAQGNVILSTEILSSLAQYVDADGLLYIRFLTEFEGTLTTSKAQ